MAERRAEEARQRAEKAQARKKVVVGAPSQEGMTPFESLMVAEAESGTYTTPKSGFGMARGNPTQELMEEQFAEGNRRLAERQARAKERAAQRMKEDLR